MHFIKSLLPVLASAALVSSAAIERRAVTAQMMVANINALTSQSQALQPIASNIQTGQTAISKRQQNPFDPVVQGLSKMSNAAAGYYQISEGSKFAAAEATQICTAYHNFVSVNQELLKVLIGKSGLVEGIFQGPMAAVLRSVEQSIDEYSFAVIDSSPDCEAKTTKDKENLDDTFVKTVCAYTPGGSLGVDLFC